MGNLISKDSYSYLTKQAEPVNSQPVIKLRQLKTLSMLKVPFYQIIYKYQNDDQLEYIYKFLHRRFVSVRLRKKKNNQVVQPYNAGQQVVFGYKLKYRHKSFDKIKNILFKKRVYGEKQYIIDALAEFKLLSILEIGPYMGTMADSTDGHLMNGYAEYYSENLVEFKTNTDKLMKKIKSVFQSSQSQCIQNSIWFSVFHHEAVLKPDIQNSPKIPIKQRPDIMQEQMSKNVLEYNPNPFPLPPPTLKLSILEDKYLKQVKAIDKATNMLSAIESYLAHKNIEKAVILYEQTVKKYENPAEKIKYIYNFVGLLEDCRQFRSYQQQVINEALDDSDLYIEETNGRNYRKQLEQKACFIKLSSKQFSSQSELQQFSQNNSVMDRSSLQKQLLKLNIQQSNKQRIKQLIKQMNKPTYFNKQNPLHLNNKIKEDEGINFQYAVMLMKSGKSRLALILFQFLLRNQEVSSEIKWKICSFMALIYYYRGYYHLARTQFEKALIRMVRMGYYSSKITLVYSNIGCTFYNQGKYERAVQIFTYALTQQYGNNDYHCLLRNNRALTYLQMGQLKQAKQQFMIILNRGQPINNGAILCKIYSNMGYLSMKSKQFVKAKEDFKLALQIQDKCLIPNGYRPSIFLHNNYAMTLYKLRGYRQALDHFSKYLNQFEQLKSIEGVMINFNISLVYKECYKNQGAKYHIQKCRRLLATLPQKSRKNYEKKINLQADNLHRDNIDQVSDESSGAVLENMMSIFSRKMQKEDRFNFE